MNPILILIILIAAGLLWALSSYLFPRIGNAVNKINKNIKNNIKNEGDNKKDGK